MVDKRDDEEVNTMSSVSHISNLLIWDWDLKQTIHLIGFSYSYFMEFL